MTGRFFLYAFAALIPRLVMRDEVVRSVARLEGDAVVGVAERLDVIEACVSADDLLGDVVVGRSVDDDVCRTG